MKTCFETHSAVLHHKGVSKACDVKGRRRNKCCIVSKMTLSKTPAVPKNELQENLHPKLFVLSLCRGTCLRRRGDFEEKGAKPWCGVAKRGRFRYGNSMTFLTGVGALYACGDKNGYHLQCFKTINRSLVSVIYIS